MEIWVETPHISTMQKAVQHTTNTHAALTLTPAALVLLGDSCFLLLTVYVMCFCCLFCLACAEVSFGAFLRPGSSATSFASNFLPQQPSLSSSSAPNQQQQQQGVGRHRKSRSSGGGGGGGGGAGALNRAAEPLAQLYSSSHGSERSGFSASRLDARSPPSDTGGKNGGGLGKRTGSSASAGAGGGGVSGVSSSAPSASGAAAAGVQKGGQVSTAMGNQMVGRMSMVVRVSEGAQRKVGRSLSVAGRQAGRGHGELSTL